MQTINNMRKITFQIIFFFFFSNLLNSQDNRTLISCDSLHTILQEIYKNDLISERTTQDKGFDLYQAMKVQNCERLPDAMNLLGILYYDQKKLIASKAILLQADSILNLQPVETPAHVRNLLYLGLCDSQNNFEGGILHYEKALRLSHKINFDKGKLQACINLGIAYLGKDNEKSLEHLQKAIQLKKISKLYVGYAFLNLGQLYLDQQNYQEAFKYVKEAEKGWLENDYFKGLYYCYLMFGKIADGDGQKKQSIEYYKKAVTISEKDSLLVPIFTLQLLGNYYYLEDPKPELAKNYYEKALDYSKYTSTDFLNEVVGRLFNLYEADGEIEKIKKVNTKLLEIYEARVDIIKLEAKQWREKELRLESLKQTKLKNELGLKQRNWILSLLSLAFLAILGIAYGQYRSKQKHKVLVDTIQSQNKTILETQDQLIVQEKLAYLGQLSAGIAHEIKNPLNFVTNFADGSLELHDDIEPILAANNPVFSKEAYQELTTILNELKQNAEDIKLHGLRIDRIVQNMMEHARNNEGELARVDLNQLVEESVNLAYHGYRMIQPSMQINFKRHYTRALPAISVYPQELVRVIINLLNNAYDAVTEKKEKYPNNYQPTVSIHTKQQNDALLIQIKDNGIGIPTSVIAQIFNPFFTTKPAQRSNAGLGLSISHEIVVKQHKGKLTVESEAGGNTTFSILLPIISAKKS